MDDKTFFMLKDLNYALYEMAKNENNKMITLENLTMTYGARLLFEGANLNLNAGSRYGVVGANGTGKSTFLRILMGEESPADGQFTFPKYSKVGWLKQDQFLFEDEPIIEIVLRGDEALWSALSAKDKLIQADDWTEEACIEIAELEETISKNDGYTAEARAQTLLSGLGIPQDYHHRPLNALSGGYKLRVLLAQTLFNNPDILLLDEPTNHLDIMTIKWLEDYLINQFRGVLVFISHDRNFLNNLSTHILDIDYGEIIEYTGNFDKFLKDKELIVIQKMTEKKHAEKKIENMQKFVDKFKYKPSKAKQAMSRMKMIEKMEVPDIKKSSRIAPNFQFKQQRHSGKAVLNVKKIAKSYGEKQVLKGVNFQVQRGERIALIGHNGIGKSTLLKIIMNLIPANEGESAFGFETHVSYFAQDHHDQLTGNFTIFEWLCNQRPQDLDSTIRNALGKMLFTQDDQFKPIQTLSGGEAARVLFARIMLENPNVIILDEPTNHLDIESINALAKALKSFDGTLIFVSHDRHFVSKIASRVIALSENGIKDHKGSYREYLKTFGDDYLNRAWLKVNQ